MTHRTPNVLHALSKIPRKLFPEVQKPAPAPVVSRANESKRPATTATPSPKKAVAFERPLSWEKNARLSKEDYNAIRGETEPKPSFWRRNYAGHCVNGKTRW